MDGLKGGAQMEPDKVSNSGSTDLNHINTTLRVPPTTRKESDRESGSTDFGPIDTKVDPGVYVDKPGYSRTPSQQTFATIETDDSRKQIFGVDENEERGNWTGRFDFLLSLLGYAVGLGNVWRFPYLCYRNGGGAFLLPFVLMMGIIGIPLFFLEAALGQFCSSGPMTCWKFSLLFKGVGISMVIVSACTSLYYNMILAWSYYYMFSSFTSVLPWSNCDNPWNTRDCSLKLPIVVCDQNGQTQYLNGTCFSNNEFVGLWNDTLFVNTTGRKRISAAEEYWNNEALKMSSSFEDFGTPKWQLVLCLMLAWIVCFFCLIKGIKSTGKVVYFTAVFPYVVLLILFFRGVTLENAGEGIYFYIVPKFERLADPRVWKDAAVQIFFSMSIAGGGLVTLSSYNRFHNNILKDSIIVSVGDTLTCIFAGFVIFSYLGYMAGQLNVSVEKVAQDGAGLAFIVYPQAVMSLPPSQLWSILFFFMLITLGLDSQFAMLETVLTGVMDQFPHLRHQKSFIIGIICIIFFLLGIPLTCNGGMYLLQLMDNYVGGWTLLLIGFVEVVCVAYVYGATRFLKDIEVMLGFPQSKWWLVCWLGISPFTLVVIFVFTFIDYQPSSYGDYNYSTWADALGWVMAVLCIIAIPITMLYMINKEDEASGLLGKLKLLITPARDWGPSLVKHRKLVTYVDGWVIDPYVEKNPRAYLNMAFSPESKRDIRLSPSNVTLSSKRTYDNRSFENSQSEYDTGSYISDYTLMSFESAV